MPQPVVLAGTGCGPSGSFSAVAAARTTGRLLPLLELAYNPKSFSLRSVGDSGDWVDGLQSELLADEVDSGGLDVGGVPH